MKNAHRFSISTAAFLLGLGAVPALAQQTPTTTNYDTDQSQRTDGLVDSDLKQDTRIEQGVKSGELTDNEAARLDRDEARIEQRQDGALSDGKLSDRELEKIKSSEYLQNRHIAALEDNNATANPDSKSSDRMADDVQRNINQQQRIDNGLDKGSLRAAEAGKLEGGQAKVDDDESRAGRNGFVSGSEQQHIQKAENGQSADIRDDRHNDITGSGTGDRDRDDKHMPVNHVRANNDGSLTVLDSNKKVDNDRDRDRIADRDNSNGRDFDRGSHNGDFDHSSDHHDHSDFDRFSGNRNHDQDKDRRDRDDHITTAQNGNMDDHDRDNHSQNGNHAMDGDRDHKMMDQSLNQPSSNDTAAMNTNNNMGTSTDNSMGSSSVSANTNNSVSGTLNGQSVTASNAPTSSMAGTSGASSGTHTAVTTPQMAPHTSMSHIVGHHQ